MVADLPCGARVVFVAGKYKNKGLTGTVDRITPHKVWIAIDGTSDRVCVNQSSVALSEAVQRSSLPRRGDNASRADAIDRPMSLVDLPCGARVVFVAGKYKNKGLTGTVDRITPHKVWIAIDGTSDRVCVNQSSVAPSEAVRRSSLPLRGDKASRAYAINIPVPLVYTGHPESATSPVGPRTASPFPPPSVSTDSEDYIIVNADGDNSASPDADQFVNAVSDDESQNDASFEDALTNVDESYDEESVDDGHSSQGSMSEVDTIHNDDVQMDETFEDAMSDEKTRKSYGHHYERFQDAVSDAEVPEFVTVVTDDEESFEDAMDAPLDPVAPRMHACSSRWLSGLNDVAPLRINGLDIDFVRLLMPEQRTHKTRTFGHCLFGNRILSLELKTASIGTDTVLPPASFRWQGRDYQILSSKLHKESLSKFSGPTMSRITAQWVAVSGIDIPTIDLESELNKIGNFAALSPQKAASRLELFESPACMHNSKDLMFVDLTSSNFEEIDGDGECGFIPKQYIERFLGARAVGKRTHSLQVRLFAPQLGIFKGMLLEKPGISTIQLPSGMKKVGASLFTSESDDMACLVITKFYPSDRNIQVEKLLRHEKVCDSFKPTRLSTMVTRLWENLGVPQNISKKYARDASINNGNLQQNLQHSFVVGVVDPTASLPEGHVFVTGFCKNGVNREELFVTRCPCMELSDGRMLPMVTAKPEEMSNEQWSWLNSLDFGSIVFADSCKGRRPLPETIANGDLDGDLYFVCWNNTILSNVHRAEAVDLRQPPDLNSPRQVGQSTAPQYGWLRESQKYVSDLRSMVERSKLIGKLYSQSLKAAKESQEGMDDVDAVLLGRAYKAALDIGKHGGKVALQRRLWDRIPAGLQKYLEDHQEE